jgi:hypothetical protein
VRHREEKLRELYAENQARAEAALERDAEPRSRDGSTTLTLTELASEAPLYEEGDLTEALRKESYGFQASEGEREESADPSGAVSLPSYDAEGESFRLCGLADTLSRK